VATRGWERRAKDRAHISVLGGHIKEPARWIEDDVVGANVIRYSKFVMLKGAAHSKLVFRDMILLSSHGPSSFG
jgi:hypothetical protein